MAERHGWRSAVDAGMLEKVTGERLMRIKRDPVRTG
jgi:hypothetical protein